MMMGPEEAMEAEQNFLQILPKIRSYKMQGNYLVLITENGGQLLFEPFSESE
jgi:heat shock protein HslJ